MKKVLKNKVFWIVFIFIAIISIVGFYGYNIYSDIKGDKEEEVPTDIVEKEFEGFILYFDSTDYQRELFANLEESYVTADATPEEITLYVDVYAKNYIADFLTLNVKDTTLNRTGGEQFLVDSLKLNYSDIDGVSDYYFTKKYYIKEHEDTYEEELPEVTALEQTEIEETTFDYYDATNTNEQKEGMQAYKLTYNVEYANTSAQGYEYFEQIEVTVANWDGRWTVVELRTNLYQEVPTVISMY